MVKTFVCLCVICNLFVNNSLAKSTLSVENLGLDVLVDTGTYYFQEMDYDSALECFIKALEIEQKKDDIWLAATLHGKIGYIYCSRGDYLLCLDSYKKAVQFYQIGGNKEKAGQYMLNIGIVYKDIGVYDEATNYLLKALGLFEGAGMVWGQASCYNSIANVQSRLGNYGRALEYHFDALELHKMMGYDEGMAGSLNNIGKTYIKMDSLEAALDYLKESLLLKTALKNGKLISSSLLNIGNVNLKMGNLDSAKVYYLKSLSIKEGIGDVKGTALVFNALGELYLKTDNNEKAEEMLLKSADLAQKINSLQILADNYRILKEVKHKMGNPTMAIVYYDKYIELKDSIFNIEKAKAISGLNIKYETEKKEQEISWLNKRKIVQEKHLMEKSMYIYILSGGVLLLLVLSFLIAKAKTKISNLLAEMQHRTGNDLQFLTGLLGRQLRKLEHTDAKEAVSTSIDNLKAISLINKMLSENPGAAVISLEVYLQKLISSIFDKFNADKIKVRLEVDVQVVMIDPAKAKYFGMIINELITNSFKYAFPNNPSPLFRVDLQKTEKSVSLKISDNGPGFPKVPTKRATAGLGVDMVKKMVKQLKGEIQIVNDTGATINMNFKKLI